MKKLAIILMLVAVLFVGGTIIDAKTTKKKSKARTSQSSTAQWNGDIPPASFIANTFFFGYDFPNNEDILKNHGYSLVTREFQDKCYVKEGICEMGIQHFAHSMEITITVYNTNQKEWLYKSIQNYIKSEGGRHSGFSVSKYGNEITFILSRWSH